MKIKIYRLISVVLIFTFLWQGVATAYPDCLRPRAMEEKIVPQVGVVYNNGGYVIEKEIKPGGETYRLKDESSNSSFEVIPQKGGTIFSFKVNGREILFTEKGIPICFPFGGKRPEEAGFFEGELYAEIKDGFMRHGFVRNDACEVEGFGHTEEGAFIKVSWATSKYDKVKQKFGDQKLTLTYFLKGDELLIRAEIENEGNGSSLWIHPWFDLQDRDNWTAEIPEPQYCEIDQNGIYTGRIIPVTAENDYRTAKTPAAGADLVLTGHEGSLITSVLHNPATGMKIEVSYTAPHTIFYASKNPGQENTVCVEAVEAPPGKLVTQRPGESRRIVEMRIRVTPPSKTPLTPDTTLTSI